MKNLEKNRNIYIKHNRFYIDYQKDGVRIRRATGLKKSPLAFDFIRKNYNLFLGSEEDIELAKSKYYELEDMQTDRIIRKGEQKLEPIKNKRSSPSACFISCKISLKLKGVKSPLSALCNSCLNLGI